mmetsp:Transcript_30964/g.61375  ORF Transcript_30964/g.61375 Transcript_30964/m.61375 type:complete len:203 (-) Transcript_30964:1457-2065(-)
MAGGFFPPPPPRFLELVVSVVELLVVSPRASPRLLPRVHLPHDGVADGLDLLLLLVVLLLLGLGVLLHPVEGLVDGVLELLLVLGRDLVGEALLVVLEGVLEVVEERLEAVPGVDPLLDLLVLLGELLRLPDHALDVLLAQPALLGRDGDLLGLAGALVLGRDLEDAVGVDLEGDVDLRHAAGGGGDASQLKLAQEVVVLGH